MFLALPKLTCPGLFVTATDTEVGKTVVACAIAQQLRRQQPGWTIGVSKPIATGCRQDREGLVSEDAEALAHFADCRQPLQVINPLRYRPAVAPAVAAEQTGIAPDIRELSRSLAVLDRCSDALIIEGIGGILVPITDRHTVLDLLGAVGYPVLVVTRATLGTLNHTTLTIRQLRAAGCRIAGLVINQYEADVAIQDDQSVATNRQWLEKLTGTSVLAVLPRCDQKAVAPEKGRIAEEIQIAVGMVHWADVLQRARSKTREARSD